MQMTNNYNHHTSNDLNINAFVICDSHVKQICNHICNQSEAHVCGRINMQSCVATPQPKEQHQLRVMNLLIWKIHAIIKLHRRAISLFTLQIKTTHLVTTKITL